MLRMKSPERRHPSPNRRRRAASLSVAAFAFAAHTAVASPSMSCNGSLVGKGDSPVSLLQKCGEPIYRQPVCLSMLQLGWVVAPYPSGIPNAILAPQCIPMEEWTYDRGPGTFFGVVRIYNGVVESVRDGDRSR